MSHKISVLPDKTPLDTNGVIGEITEEVNCIDLNSIQSVGIELNPRKWDFVHYYPPLGSLPPINSAELGFLRESIDQPLALYFHIPFCSGLCIYCYYMKYEKPTRELVDKYLNYLHKEFLLIPEKVRAQKIHSVMIGGGTPTFLNEEQITYLFKIIKDNFNINSDIEISFEASPETITIEKLLLLKKVGVNRLSIGIQSFDDSILKKINRRHTSGESLASIYKIQKADFGNYNIDIMYGLPYQTIEQVCCDLEFLNEIKPPSISFYQLWFSPEKPFGPNLPIEFISERNFPDIKKILAMKMIIRNFMRTLGYYQDQTCWFIKSARERCNQQVFRWENNSYLGFGLSSYGYYKDWAYMNCENIKGYFKMIDEGFPPVYRAKRLSREEITTRAFVLGLKLTEGIDVYSFRRKYGESSLSFFTDKLTRLENTGLLSVSDSRITFTELGRLFDDEVCRQFF